MQTMIKLGGSSTEIAFPPACATQQAAAWDSRPLDVFIVTSDSRSGINPSFKDA
jgi:hypothetical protein